MPDEMFGPVSDDERMLVAYGLKHIIEDLTHLCATVCHGTALQAPGDVYDLLAEKGFDDPADTDGAFLMNQVPHLMDMLSALGVYFTRIAIFDGSMDEATREEFFPGEFLVGEDGEVVYSLSV